MLRLKSANFLKIFEQKRAILITFFKFLQIYVSFCTLFSRPSIGTIRIFYPYHQKLENFCKKTIKIGNLQKIEKGSLLKIQKNLKFPPIPRNFNFRLC